MDVHLKIKQSTVCVYCVQKGHSPVSQSVILAASQVWKISKVHILSKDDSLLLDKNKKKHSRRKLKCNEAAVTHPSQSDCVWDNKR